MESPIAVLAKLARFPRLNKMALKSKLPGARVLDGQFSAVQQAMGINKGNDAALAWLEKFVEDAKASGLVARLIVIRIL